MRLKELQLKNYGCHADLTVKFHQGLNAITGPNGAGKSTIVEALRFAIIGRSSVYGTKEDNITAYQLVAPTESPENNGTAKSGKSKKANGITSFVRLSFTHRGAECEIIRAIRNCNSILKIADRTWRKETEINEEFAAFLELPMSFIDNHVLVGQSAIVGFMTESPSLLIENISETFGLDQISKCYDALNEVEKKLTIVPYDETLERLSAQQADLDTKLKGLDRQLVQFTDIMDDISDIVNIPEFKVVTNYLNSKKDKTNRSDWERTLANAEKDLNESQQLIARLDTDLNSLEREKAELGTNLETVNAGLLAWEKFNKHQEKVVWFETQIKTQEVKLTKLIAPEVPVTTAENPTEAKAQVNAELFSLNKFLESFKNGNSECPTCGTVVDNLNERLEQGRIRLVELKNALDKYKNECDAIAIYNNQISRYSIEANSIKEALERYQIDIARLGTMEAPAEDLTALLETKQKLERIARITTERKSKLDNARFRYENALAMQENCKKTLATLTVVDCDISETDYLNAQEIVDHFKTAISTKAKLKLTREEAQKNYNEVTTWLEETKAKAAKQQKKVDFLARVRKLRDVMSKDKLQKDAVCTVLETIITAVNINLAEFDAPFYIKGYWDKMRICAHVNADALYDVRRLSGGQKTLLALAARVAIASYFASNIGLLVLDEPTAALDKGNQTCVETVVEIMRKHVDNSSDMQLIVVTHEHLLARACDSVLTLSPPFEEKHVN